MTVITSPAVVPEVGAGRRGEEPVVRAAELNLVGGLADIVEGVVAAAALVAAPCGLVHAQHNAVTHYVFLSSYSYLGLSIRGLIILRSKLAFQISGGY